MATNCNKCWMMKMTPNSKCACNVKKFDEAKLSKKTRVEKKQKPIAQKSEKRKALDKQRWWFDIFFKKVLKTKVNDNWDWVCEYCQKSFNIQQVLNQATCFAHILSKWNVSYVHLAMFINNIAYVCWEECHKSMDQEICELKIKPELQKRIEKLEKIDVWNLIKYIT